MDDVQPLGHPALVEGEVVRRESRIFLSQFYQTGEVVKKILPYRHRIIFPADRLFFKPLISLPEDYVIPQFLELPQHLRTRYCQEECGCKLHPLDCRVEIPDIVTSVSQPIHYVKVHYPLLIMTLHIIYNSRTVKAKEFPRGIRQI